MRNRYAYIDEAERAKQVRLEAKKAAEESRRLAQAKLEAYDLIIAERTAPTVLVEAEPASQARELAISQQAERERARIQAEQVQAKQDIQTRIDNRTRLEAANADRLANVKAYLFKRTAKKR